MVFCKELRISADNSFRSTGLLHPNQEGLRRECKTYTCIHVHHHGSSKSVDTYTYVGISHLPEYSKLFGGKHVHLTHVCSSLYRSCHLTQIHLRVTLHLATTATRNQRVVDTTRRRPVLTGRYQAPGVGVNPLNVVEGAEARKTSRRRRRAVVFSRFLCPEGSWQRPQYDLLYALSLCFCWCLSYMR